MTQIGTFTRNEDGFFGDIRTLTLDARLSILPADHSGSDNAPGHRIYCEGSEIGAAWQHRGEKAGTYFSLVIDDPSFAQPLRAALFLATADEDVWTLHWTRPPRRAELAE